MAAPYAYVIEYRVTDACSPPNCRLDGRRTFGRASGAPPGENDGAYVAIGSDKHELFATRGLVLAASREIRFVLPPREERSALDMSLAAGGEGGGTFRAVP